MQTLRHLFFAALFAGLLAGGLATAGHQFGTVPLILRAEAYEQAAKIRDPAPTAPAQAAELVHDHAGDAGHRHAADAEHGAVWSPVDGAERTLYTLLANLLAGVAYALLLVGALALHGGAADWRRGLVWGLAGFAAFVLAPALGLPPEVPGTEAAPVADRQLWWAATAALTASGLALLAFGRNVAFTALGAALIVLPHLVGAPSPPDAVPLAPEWLSHRFVVLSTVVNFVFWVVLGAATGHRYGRPIRA